MAGIQKRMTNSSGGSSYTAFGIKAEAQSIAPGLHVVATPIGNLGDITFRALRTLAAAKAVLAEDTRVSRRLLAHYGITTPMIAYHEHNAAEMRPKILARLAAGEALALISDAGTPLVSDPGYKLVEAAIEEGFHVTSLPGPSAVLAALVVSGLPTDRFFFEGFLPPKSSARQERLSALAAIPGTLVFFESPRRVAAMLADAAAILGNRSAAVARELTKFYETVRRGTLNSLSDSYGSEDTPKGEIVVLIGPPVAAPVDADDDINLDRLLTRHLGTLSIKDAASVVAEETGLPRRRVYARAIALSRIEDG
jgi:16S rRNA (cytidine1402-2'-O)-methyltransferase